jgi:hypothetical protein
MQRILNVRKRAGQQMLNFSYLIDKFKDTGFIVVLKHLGQYPVDDEIANKCTNNIT